MVLVEEKSRKGWGRNSMYEDGVVIKRDELGKRNV